MTSCPAIIISAPASGNGKTTVTAAIARYHKNQGRKVQIFKVGPDFIDPMILEQASGNPVYQLDLWMVGQQQCKALIYQKAQQADLILIEGMMGLFDGEPCTADLAEHFGIPVVAVIDASAMAQTFGAVAHGLKSYRDQLPFYGVIANRIASEGHGEMVADSMLDPGDYLGAIYRNPEVSLAERHLGLQQASELVNLDQTLDLSAKAIQQTQLAELPPAVSFASSELEWYPPLLQGRSIAIACDDAFRFVYPANSDALREMGAKLIMVSPIADSELPDCDALYLPGGYPELHAQKLAANTSFLAGVRKHVEQQKPILAECGGMLYLMQSLTDLDGQQHALSGVLPGTAKMQDKLAAIGMQYLDWPQTDQQVRGHTFHYSNSSVALEPIAHSQSYPYNKQGEAVYQQGNVTASYMHFYFASNPHLIAQLFGGGDAS